MPIYERYFVQHCNICRPEEHIDFKAPPSTTPIAPYCTEVVNLEYSIHAFEHLEVHHYYNLSFFNTVHAMLLVGIKLSS